MRDGLPYVVAAYAVIAVTLGVWFWMMLAKVARLRRQPAPLPRLHDGHEDHTRG